MDKTNIVKLARDLYHGHVDGNFSAAQSSEALRLALVEANGGSSVIDRKSLRRNGTAIFEIIEEIIPALVIEGLQGDEFFMNLVEYRNVALGDQNMFVVEADSNFVVAEISDGNAVPRRQRIGEQTSMSVKTTLHSIRMYEELSRVLAGRIDWNTFVDKVAKAFRIKLYEDVFAAFKGISASTIGLNETYVKGGTYNEEDLLAIVDHVEAATGKKATIVGTRPALRKCSTAVVSHEAESDYYNAGFYGKLAGVPMVAIKNQHKAGTDEFIFEDNKLYIIASDDKPIKVVNEGDPTIIERDMTHNDDMSLEYLYIEKYGVALIINGKIGVYTIA